MASKASWFETGYEGAEKEQAKKDLGYPPDRWWLAAGDTREIVYIDDIPFNCHVHSWCNHDGSWFHETCLAKVDDSGCPADGAKGVGRADYTGHLTVVDVTGYVDKDGNEHKYQLKVFPGKTKVLNKLKGKKERKGSLLGQLWTLTRADKNTPRTGDELEHVREIDMDKFYPFVTYKGKFIQKLIEAANGNGSDAVKTRKYLAHHFQIPDEGPIPEQIPLINYAAQYAPKDAKLLRTLVADAKPFKNAGGGSNSSPSSSSSDDVPF